MKATAAAAANSDLMPTGGQPSTSGNDDLSNVMYIGHIPHGFYEDQMRGFFEQFGTVSKLRLSRNKKTGKSKHFAFLEFATPEIAGIVADAMNDYMLMGQKLQCRVLLQSEVHEDLWKGANRRFRAIPWRKVELKRHNAPRTPEQSAQRLQRAVARDRKRMARIAAAGIEYEYDVLEAPRLGKKRAAPADDKEARPAKKAAKTAATAKKQAEVVKKAAKAKGRAADLDAKPAKRSKKADKAA